MSNLQRIDEEQYNELSELLEDSFNDLIGTFIADSAEKMQAINSALANQDNRAGYDAAHSIKGASVNLGANILADLCFQLQQVCSEKMIVTAEDLVKAIDEERALLVSELEKRIA